MQFIFINSSDYISHQNDKLKIKYIPTYITYMNQVFIHFITQSLHFNRYCKIYHNINYSLEF